jgi:superfamily II DNA or RNA helicase
LKRGGGDVHALISATEAVFTDECHAAGGPGNYDVLQRLDNAYYRIGASGTPLNRKPKERMHIVGALGPIIAKVTTEELVKRKVLAQSVIRMIPVPQTGRSTSDWRGVYSELIVHSIKRNMALVHIAKEATKPSLLFVQELEHAENVMSLLALHGVKAESATGSDWNNTRVDKIARLVSGEFDVLVCTVIFQEGIDVPALASIIVGTGQMSPVACLQRLGRGIRISEGKTHFELWDVLDTGQKWLTKHSIARREAYESEGHTVTIGW